MHRRHVQACLARACLASETKPQVRGSIRKEGKDRLDIWTLEPTVEPGSQHHRCGDSSMSLFNVWFNLLVPPSMVAKLGFGQPSPRQLAFGIYVLRWAKYFTALLNPPCPTGLQSVATILAPRVCDSVTCTRQC